MSISTTSPESSASPNSGPQSRSQRKSQPRKNPRNLGPVSMKWLEAVDVHTLEDIEELGPVEIYLRVEDAGFHPGRNLLWSLQGAVLDLAWSEIPPDMKKQLEREVAAAREADREVFVPALPEVVQAL